MTAEEEHTRKLLCYMDSICSEEIDNIGLIKFFQLLLTAHWENGNNHGKYSDSLGCLSTTPGHVSGMRISSSIDANPKDITAAPQINIRLGETKFLKTHMDDKVGESDDGNVEHKVWTASTMLRLTHTFETPAQAQFAAASNLEFISAISGELKKILNLIHIQPVLLSDFKKEKNGGSDNFNVDLVFDISYNYYVSVNLETHRIKVIASNISI